MPTTLLKNPVSAVTMEVTGIAAEATAGGGTQPANTLTVTGAAGQATTGTGESAGDGAMVAITAGNGGTAPSGSTNGKGGSVTIDPGAPGAGAGTAATYGNVLLATTGGMVGVGTTTPTASVEIYGTGRAITSTRVGSGGQPVTFTVRKANTGVTAVTSGHEVGAVIYSGFDGTAYTIGARTRTIVDAAVTTGSVPMALTFFTGAGTLGERMRINSSGNIGINTPTPTSKLHVNGGVQVGAPTGGDMGTGTINVSGDIYKNGTAFTNPDYVFEHHFSGSASSGYAGPVPLDALEETIREQGQLPGVGREPMGVFGRQDMLLEKLEEAYLYIIELTKRVDRLEAEAALTSGGGKS